MVLLERGDIAAAIGWFQRAADGGTPELRQRIDHCLATIRDRLGAPVEAYSGSP
jgi:hypothetical protein